MSTPNFIPTAEFKRRFELGRKTRAVIAARELCIAFRAMTDRTETETQLLMKLTRWIVAREDER